MRRRFHVSERLTIEMSWRLAAALTAGLITGTVGALQWSRAYGDELVAKAVAEQDAKLKHYPTLIELQDLIMRMNAERRSEYWDLRERIDNVKEMVKQNGP